jgi:hypothetical protein
MIKKSVELLMQKRVLFLFSVAKTMCLSAWVKVMRIIPPKPWRRRILAMAELRDITAFKPLYALLLLCFIINICMEQEEDVEQMNFFLAFGKRSCIYYALEKQIQLFKQRHSIEEEIPAFTPFIQAHSCHESVALSYLAKNCEDTRYDWPQVCQEDSYIHWKSKIIGVPLDYFDGATFCVLVKYEGKKYAITYNRCPEGIGVSLQEKIEAFRKNPLVILEGQDFKSTIIKNYITILLQANIIVQKGKRYCHGPRSCFAEKERAEYNRSVLERIDTFLNNSNVDQVLLLLRYQRDKGNM